VHDALGFEEKAALLNHHVLMTDTAADASTVDERELVFVLVSVRNDESAGAEDGGLCRESALRVGRLDELAEGGSQDRLS
jgi:hypothetical protein